MKNSFLLGLLLGAISPLLAYGLTNYTALAQQWFPSKPFAFYVVAAGINLLLMRIFFRKETPQDKLAKGILLTTFLGMLLCLYFFKLQA